MKLSFPNHLRAMLAIIQEIKSDSYPSCADLMRLTNRDRRSVMRDLSILRNEFGAPIRYHKGRKGYYILGEWSFLNKSQNS